MSSSRHRNGVKGACEMGTVPIASGWHAMWLPIAVKWAMFGMRVMGLSAPGAALAPKLWVGLMRWDVPFGGMTC